MKKNLATSIVLITFVMVGCGTPTGSAYITPQQISDPKIGEITPTFETQIERINNCDGANPTYNVSYKTIETQKATFEVSVGAGGLVTGTPVPSILEVQLEAKITAALAKDYGLTTEKNHDITLENPKGKFLEHTIEWKVTRVKGLIDVIYGDGVAQVGFDKIANVELYNRTSKSLGCDGNSISVPPTSTVSSNTIPPTKIVSNLISSVSDDFSDSSFDGSFNKNLWQYWAGYNSSISQQNGVLAISNATHDDIGLISKKFNSFPLNSPISYEAKLMLSSTAHTGALDMKIGTDINGGYWDTECNLAASASDSKALAFCWAGTGKGTEYSPQSKYVDFDTWHTFRIEIDSETMKITYYIDSEMVGSFTLDKGDELRNSRYYVVLSVHSVTSSITGYFDDVKIEKK